MWEILKNWANSNQGILSLIAILIATPTLVIIGFQGFGWVRNRKNKKRLSYKDEVEHASKLRKEIESKVEWQDFHKCYDTFLIRDPERKLPETEENHSSIITPYSINVLLKIEKEYLEFSSGCLSNRFIKQVADFWIYSDKSDAEAIQVETVVRLNYRDIEFIRWDTDQYWEWPQICCRFTTKNKFPFSKIYFAKVISEDKIHFLRHICDFSELDPSTK